MFAIAVNSGCEKEAFEQFKSTEGIKPILPSCIRQRRHGGVWREYESIIIPGYIFIECKFSDEIYYKVKNSLHVKGWLGGAKPVKMIEKDAEFIKFIGNDGKPMPLVDTKSEIVKRATANVINKRARKIKLRVEVFGQGHVLTLGLQTRPKFPSENYG